MCGEKYRLSFASPLVICWFTCSIVFRRVCVPAIGMMYILYQHTIIETAAFFEWRGNNIKWKIAGGAQSERGGRRCACKTGCNHSNRFRSALRSAHLPTRRFLRRLIISLSSSRRQFRIHQRLVIKIKENPRSIMKKTHLSKENKGANTHT